MAVEERAWHHVYEQLRDAIGEEATATLMGYLRPVDWSSIATRADVDAASAALAVELRGEMRELATQLRGEMQELATQLRGEMQELATQLRGEMQGIAAELRGEMQGIAADLRKEVREATQAQTRTLVFAQIGSVVSIVGLAVALSRVF